MKRALASAFSLIAMTTAVVADAAAAEPLQSTQFRCDGLSISGRLDPGTVRALEPAHSLDAAAAVLTQRKVKFVRRRGTMMLADVPEKLIQQIYQLPQGEPIVLPDGEDSTICVIVPAPDSI